MLKSIQMSNFVSFKNLKNAVLEPISYYIKGFNIGFSMDMHQHTYFEIMYAYKGSFIFEVFEDENSSSKDIKSYEVTAGQFIFIDAMTFHKIKITSSKDVIIYNIELEIKKNDQYNPFNINDILPIKYDMLIKNSGLKTVANEDKFIILSDIEQVDVCMKNLIIALSSKITSLEMAVNVQCLLISLFMEISKCANNTVSGTISYIKRANKYIIKNFTSKISIDNIAEYAGINKAYLQRQYKKYNNQTILTTINQLRVQKACQLLRSSNILIDDIAKQVGFSRKEQLYYVFKGLMGISPSKYRDTYIQSEIDHHYHSYISNAISVDD